MHVVSIFCPNCHAGDLVRCVSAVVMDGQASVHLSGGYVGMVGLTPSGGVIGQSGQSVTHLAALLSPPPLPRPRSAWYICIVVLLLYVGCWACAGALAWPDATDQANGASPVVGVLAPLVFASPGLGPCPRILDTGWNGYAAFASVTGWRRS